MTLSEVEELFYGVVTGEVDAGDARVAEAFVSDHHLGASDRLQIYADMVFARQVEALEDEFPMLRALLDADPFADLCREYLRAHPSAHPDIGQLGRKLPEFIGHHAQVRGDLRELAQIELTRNRVFCAAEAAPCAVDALVALGPEAFAGVRLAFVPALQTLPATHDAAGLWTALQDGERPPASALDAPISVAVWKKAFEVFHAPLSVHESAALAAAMVGAPLGEVCEAFAEVDDPAGTAFSAIASWFGEGWVAQVRPPGA